MVDDNNPPLSLSLAFVYTRAVVPIGKFEIRSCQCRWALPLYVEDSLRTIDSRRVAHLSIMLHYYDWTNQINSDSSIVNCLTWWLTHTQTSPTQMSVCRRFFFTTSLSLSLIGQLISARRLRDARSIENTELENVVNYFVEWKIKGILFFPHRQHVNTLFNSIIIGLEGNIYTIYKKLRTLNEKKFYSDFHSIIINRWVFNP